jgi:molecular chaperone GrpE (heat shock protein)
MNKERRKQLAKAQEMLEDAKSIIEDCLSDEEDYRDNMPENLQGSEKYDIADSACYNMESVIDSIDSAVSCVEEAQE